MKRLLLVLTVDLVVVVMIGGYGAAIAFAAATNNPNADCLGVTVSRANDFSPGTGGEQQSERAQSPSGAGDIASSPFCRGGSQ